MGHTAKINGRHASGWRWSGVAKFGKVLVVAQLMSRMVGDALAAQAEGAQHRWQGAASPQGGARKGAGHRSAQPQQKPACLLINVPYYSKGGTLFLIPIIFDIKKYDLRIYQSEQ